MARIFFIADTHFGHANIIRHCGRPFADADEMDRYMIQAWNARVRPEDTVYTIGDFSFRVPDPKRYADACSGRKILVRGNHDKKLLKDPAYTACFEDVQDMMELSLGGRRLVLCHYPMAEWPGYYQGAWLIYGHIHNHTGTETFQFLAGQERALNAGADITQFAPASFEELVAYNKAFKEAHAGDAPD